MNTHKKGFTLIELLVVLSIISLLSSIVLATLQGARDKAINARKLTMANQYVKALELAFDANGSYPTLAGTGMPRTCLGVGNPIGYCFDSSTLHSPYSISESNPNTAGTVNNILKNFIPGPPANTDSVLIGTTNYSGIGYACLPYDYSLGGPGANQCSNPGQDGYAIFWVMRGVNTSCAGGFVDSDQNLISVSGITTNTLCVYASSKTLYDTIELYGGW